MGTNQHNLETLLILDLQQTYGMPVHIMSISAGQAE
jgi:hypothetical protein